MGEQKQWGQIVKRICLDCSHGFDTLNLGRHTAIYCFACREIRRKQEEEKERLSQQQQEAEYFRDMVRSAKIPPKWQTVTFGNSNTTNNPKAFQFTRQYAETFSLKSSSLVLYSPGAGTGKTHLLACIANYVLFQKRIPVLFQKARDLMLELRKTFSDKEESEADVLNRVLSVPLLVLDDVGVDPLTKWLEATYWSAFDRRLEWQLPIVISTNKPIEGNKDRLANWIGERAVSRLVEMCAGQVIDMTGDDLR